MSESQVHELRVAEGAFVTGDNMLSPVIEFSHYRWPNAFQNLYNLLQIAQYYERYIQNNKTVQIIYFHESSII